MKPAFIAFAVTLALLTVATAVAGWFAQGADTSFLLHFALGFVTTLLTCLCHCVVLAYFMATGKVIRLAVDDAKLDPTLLAHAQQLKLRAYAWLMPAILVALLAAFAGGWATIHPDRTPLHLYAAITSALFQCIGLTRLYTCIAANGRLLDRVLAQHQDKAAS